MNDNDWNQQLRKDIDWAERVARLVVVCTVVAGALFGWWLS